MQQIAVCCQGKGFAHCGECGIMPCDKLYAYSYLDPEHGDTPQGARVQACRDWAAASGIHKWENVLLTSAGFCDWDGNKRPAIIERFRAMVGKPLSAAKVLFVPTAAYSPERPEPPEYLRVCFNDLSYVGVLPENITTYDVDGSMTVADIMGYDCVYVSGGHTAYLLKRVRETGFADIIKRFVYANKVYVGVSAGSLIAQPNLGKGYDGENIGLCLINAYFDAHCERGTPPRTDLPLPHIPLTDNALAVSWEGWALVGDCG